MASPLTISTVNPKGGTGKSTIAVHLAVAACREGYSVRLVDTDPQGTALDWSRHNPDGYSGPAVRHVPEDERVAPAISGAEVVVVDSPARLDERTGAVLAVSDIALVPVRPSGLDLWGTEEFLEELNTYTEAAGLLAAFVGSQRDVRTTLSDELTEVLSRQGYPFFGGLTSRVAYARSMSEGRTVLDGYDPAAAEEVTGLLKDVGRLGS